MNIAAAQTTGTEFLQQADIAEFRREASSLLAFVLEKDATFLIAHPEFELTAAQALAFENAIQRRAAHEPFQYITGKQEFWGLEFEVTPDVLIPRPETEILVEAAVRTLSQIECPRFCEVGVGSGCVAVSIAHAHPAATAVGTDVSPAALTIATRNAKRHNVDQQIDFRAADVFDGVTDVFDLIVSNPPYVPDEEIEALQTEVRDFEPRAALSGGRDGTDVIRRIVAEAPKFLKPGGSLLIEIGFDQAARVKGLFEKDLWPRVELLPDLQGIPRIVVARHH